MFTKQKKTFCIPVITIITIALITEVDPEILNWAVPAFIAHFRPYLAQNQQHYSRTEQYTWICN